MLLFILSWYTVFSLHFNIFIHSSTMSQSAAASAPTLTSNVLALIQLCYLCCVCQIVHLANACNVTDVYWCDHCCLLNKHCWLINSMQGVKELLMSKRFHQISMLPSTTFFVNIATPTTKLQAKVTTTVMLHFIMWCRWLSPVSFKLTKLLLQSAAKLHQQYACISQL